VLTRKINIHANTPHCNHHQLTYDDDPNGLGGLGAPAERVVALPGALVLRPDPGDAQRVGRHPVRSAVLHVASIVLPDDAGAVCIARQHHLFV